MSRLPALLTVLALSLTVAACGGDPADSTSSSGSSPPVTTLADELDVPAGFTALEVDGAALAHPSGWTRNPAGEVKDVAASFRITEGGQTVGQLDVLVNTVPPGAQADAIAASVTGKRSAQLDDLRTPVRTKVDVPGASSGFRTESTYTTNTGEPAHSIEQLAIGADGAFVLVRVSAAQSAYDAETFTTLLDTLRIQERGAAA